MTMIAGFARSYAPRVDDDMPLIVVCIGFLLIALVPHSAHEYGGPLCASSTLFHATERVLRAFLFATVYCVIACAGEILMPRQNGLFVASIRACGASVWILACSVWILPLSVIQIVMVVWSRFRRPEGFESMPITSVSDSDLEADSDVNSGIDHEIINGVGNGSLKYQPNVNGPHVHNSVSSVSTLNDVDAGPFRLSLNGHMAGSHVRPSAEQMRQMADSI